MIAFFFATSFAVLVIIGAGLFIMTSFYHVFVVRCPFVPTTRLASKSMVALARLKGTERVYDLGAGDGAVLIEAVRLFPKLRATGIERVITIRWIGKIRMWISGIHVELRGGDIFNANVSDADVIFLYLMPEIMNKLEEKFTKELRPGTIIVSHAFRFPNREAQETLKTDGTTLLRYVW